MTKQNFSNPFEKSIYNELRKAIRKTDYLVEYETEKLFYKKSYLPDYVLKVVKSGTAETVCYIETKGWFRPEDRFKMLAVKRENPEVDIRFVFQKDNTINKRSKTKYSQWCDKHGFKYAIGEVPKEWFT